MKKLFVAALVLLVGAALAWQMLWRAYRVPIGPQSVVDVRAGSRGEALALIGACGVRAATWNASAATLYGPADNNIAARRCVADREARRYAAALPRFLYVWAGGS